MRAGLAAVNNPICRALGLYSVSASCDIRLTYKLRQKPDAWDMSRIETREARGPECATWITASG